MITLYGFSFPFYDVAQWRAIHFVIWGGLVLAALYNMNHSVLVIPRWLKVPEIKAPEVPRPYTARDRIYVAIAKVVTMVWTYQYVKFAWVSPQVKWHFGEVTFTNTVIAFLLLFVVYDFFYYSVHRIAHSKALFKYCHRHHHRQTTPVRGNEDGINANPVELVIFEYIHNLAAYLVCVWILPVSGGHVLAVMGFFLVCGFLAGLGHTRFDINIPILSRVWQSQHHATHHTHMNKNFGQYVMLWDVLLGTFRQETR